jgi:hypothetical protein
VVSLTYRPLHHRGTDPGYHWIGGWVGPRDSRDAVAKRRSYLTLAGIEPLSSSLSLVTILTDMFGVKDLNPFCVAVKLNSEMKQTNRRTDVQFSYLYLCVNFVRMRREHA